MIVTIDGTGGSGKGTIAKMLAEKTSGLVLDTGLMYRALGWAVRESPLIEQENFCVIGLHTLTFEFVKGQIKLTQVHGDTLESMGISDQVFQSEEVAQRASKVGVHRKVRELMVIRQRKLVAEANAAVTIVDARDGGTHIFPQAEFKVFLYCSAEEAGKRRAYQASNLKAAPAFAQSIAERNHREITRAVAPLTPAPGALIIDTTRQPIGSVFAQVWQHYQEVNASLKLWQQFKDGTNENGIKYHQND